MNLKTVCLLLGLCHAGSAAALGLGELSIRSSLGQPLHATIRILGANDKTQADCFSVRASADSAAPPPVRTQLSLDKRGDEAVLHIRTPAPVNDPIAQFTLTSDCEARLQREYVVLLDPPSPARLQNVPLVGPTDAPLVEPAPARPASAAPSSRDRAPQAAPDASSGRTARQTAAPKRSTPRKPARDVESDPAPRLVLSGRRGTAPGALSLRFDTELPDLNRPRVEGLTPDELSDENTALTRKLAHLESQLQDLTRRNAELEARRGALPTHRTPLTTTGLPPRWPIYALLTALVVVGALFMVLLRRRRRTTDDDGAHTLEPVAADLDRMGDDSWTTRPHPVEAMDDATPAGEVKPRVTARDEPIADFDPPAMAETPEVNDDILDQAEVYMAHGHGDLAIHLLQEHLRAAPDESPVPWLLLLDLLQREGDTAGYATASTECRKYFNINLSTAGTPAEHEGGVGIEDYPHILEQLIRVWGTDEAENFFEDLIFDRRGGTRIGFAPGAYREILMLRTIALSR